MSMSMNPLIKRQFDLIHEEIGRLRETLASEREALEKHRADKGERFHENLRSKVKLR